MCEVRIEKFPKKKKKMRQTHWNGGSPFLSVILITVLVHARSLLSLVRDLVYGVYSWL